MKRSTLLLSLTAMLLAGEPERITCTPQKLYHCIIDHCEEIALINLDGLSQSFTIYPKKHLITGQSEQDRFVADNLRRNRQNSEAYVFFGLRPNTRYDWVLSIDKQSGDMTVGSVKSDESYTIFGRCDWKGRP